MKVDYRSIHDVSDARDGMRAAWAGVLDAVKERLA